MDDFLKKMAHLRSDFRDVQQHIDAKVDNILEMLASMQQHLQMQEMSKGKEVGVSLCCAEIHSQHQIVTSATSSEEAESRAKVHLENLELVFEKPYENAKLQSCSEKPVLMCAQQVFDEISKLEKLEILDAPLLTCEHKFDKEPESTLIVSNYADVVRKVDAYVCPLGVLDLTEVIEKIVAPLENFQSIEVSLNTKMIERDETKLKIGDDKNEADDGLLNETRKWMGSVLGKPVVVICFSKGKGVIMFYELRVFDYLTDKKFDPGGDGILEVAGMRFHLYFLGIFLHLFAPKFDGYAGENNFQFSELVCFFYEHYFYFNHNKVSSPTLKMTSPTTTILKFLRPAIFTVPCFMMCLMLLRIMKSLCKNDECYLILMKNDQVHQLYLCGGIAAILFARKGNKPLVVASGGFSRIFFDSSWNTYFTDSVLEINARLDGVSSILAVMVVGVGTVSSSVPTGNKEVSVLMFDQPLPKPPPQFRYLSREDTTISRGEYCCGNGARLEGIGVAVKKNGQKA